MMTAARQHGAADIALNSAGNAGQAAAAYAARADLDAHVYLPSRAGVHPKGDDRGPRRRSHRDGSDRRQLADRRRRAGVRDAMDAHPDWYSAKTFVTPYRHEGKKTMALELLEQLDWEAPDGVVYPTGGASASWGCTRPPTRFGSWDGPTNSSRCTPRSRAGCAPVVDAYEAGADRHEPVPDDEVDTACNGIAIPDPGASPLILDAIRESEGGAVATTDREILDAAIEVARAEGLEVGATCAACVSGAFALAESGSSVPTTRSSS